MLRDWVSKLHHTHPALASLGARPQQLEHGKITDHEPRAGDTLSCTHKWRTQPAYSHVVMCAWCLSGILLLAKVLMWRVASGSEAARRACHGWSHRSWWTGALPHTCGCAISGCPPSCALCRPFLRNATGQTTAFLFLLLAAVVDCLWGKFPELRLAGVSFDLKPLLVSTLCFPSMLPSSSTSWTAHLPKLLPHPLLTMVHVRQYFQEFHALSLYTVPPAHPQRVWVGYFLLWLKETCPLM